MYLQGKVAMTRPFVTGLEKIGNISVSKPLSKSPQHAAIDEALLPQGTPLLILSNTNHDD